MILCAGAVEAPGRSQGVDVWFVAAYERRIHQVRLQLDRESHWERLHPRVEVWVIKQLWVWPPGFVGASHAFWVLASYALMMLKIFLISNLQPTLRRHTGIPLSANSPTHPEIGLHRRTRAHTPQQLFAAAPFFLARTPRCCLSTNENTHRIGLLSMSGRAV